MHCIFSYKIGTHKVDNFITLGQDIVETVNIIVDDFLADVDSTMDDYIVMQPKPVAIYEPF